MCSISAARSQKGAGRSNANMLRVKACTCAFAVKSDVASNIEAHRSRGTRLVLPWCMFMFARWATTTQRSNNGNFRYCVHFRRTRSSRPDTCRKSRAPVARGRHRAFHAFFSCGLSSRGSPAEARHESIQLVSCVSFTPCVQGVDTRRGRRFPSRALARVAPTKTVRSLDISPLRGCSWEPNRRLQDQRPSSLSIGPWPPVPPAIHARPRVRRLRGRWLRELLLDVDSGGRSPGSGHLDEKSDGAGADFR